MVLGFIGWQTCGRHPARRQSWPDPGRLRLRRGSSLGSPATTAARPCRAMIKPFAASTSRAWDVAGPDALQRAHLGNGRQLVARGEDPGPDGFGQCLSDLLPGWAGVAWVDRQDRDITGAR